MRKWFTFWRRAWWGSLKIGGIIVGVISGEVATALAQVVMKRLPGVQAMAWVQWVLAHSPEVILLAACLGATGYFILYAPYVIFRDLELRSSTDYKAMANEIQGLRQELHELKARRTVEEEAEIEGVVTRYCALFAEHKKPDDPGHRMKILLESGLMSLRETPSALPSVQSGVKARGVSNPFGGSEELGEGHYWSEQSYWDVENLWPWLDQAQKYNLFSEDEGKRWYDHYLNIPDDEPLIATPILKQEERYLMDFRDLDQEPSEPSSMEAGGPPSSSQPETPVSTPLQA